MFPSQPAQVLRIHPTHPQQRLIQVAVDILNRGGVVIAPTDVSYALLCNLTATKALDQIKRIRQLDDKHHFTLICPNLAELGSYAQVDNPTYRFLKTHIPGPYTFLLTASRQVPRRLQHPKKKTIGLRVPEHPILHQLLEKIGEPIFSTTLKMPSQEDPLADPEEIIERLEKHVDCIIDGGWAQPGVTTIIDLTGPNPECVREGVGVSPYFNC